MNEGSLKRSYSDEEVPMPGVAGTMREYKAGTLHSGSKAGPIVTNRKQAIAIAMSKEREKKNKVQTDALGRY